VITRVSMKVSARRLSLSTDSDLVRCEKGILTGEGPAFRFPARFPLRRTRDEFGDRSFGRMAIGGGPAAAHPSMDFRTSSARSTTFRGLRSGVSFASAFNMVRLHC